MEEEIARLEREARKAIAQATNRTDLKQIEVKFLGKKGRVTGLLRSMSQVPVYRRKEFGQAVNTLKKQIAQAISSRKEQLVIDEMMTEVSDPAFDPTLPGLELAPLGVLHPLTQIEERIIELFTSMGFIVPDYPEAESPFFNFEALNIPEDHPARDLQDTFWLEDGNLLRTHTSPGQIRAMRDYKPPFRAIFPGKVYRFEATDASHEHTFHQLEGLLIDTHVSAGNMLHSMKVMLDEIFEHDVKVRLRPGYFPFVEPGFELDVQCEVCNGKGCAVCKQSGWVEQLGCGLVHPKVIQAGGLDPTRWTGWAFGLGLSRLVMMKFQISDIRHIMSGDLRFIRQFRHRSSEL